MPVAMFSKHGTKGILYHLGNTIPLIVLLQRQDSDYHSSYLAAVPMPASFDNSSKTDPELNAEASTKRLSRYGFGQLRISLSSRISF